MRTRVLSATCALALGLALLAGCSSDNNSEWQRVVCEVKLVNDGAPLVAAYVQDGGDGVIGVDPLSGTSDDTFPLDQAIFEFRARPYSLTTMTIPEDDVYSSFIITGYTLTWEGGINMPAGLDLSQFNVTDGSLYLQVPVYGEQTSAIMVADRLLKEEVIDNFGSSWPAGWGAEQDFTATARVTFTGHDSGSEHETTIHTGMNVTFTYALTQD